MFHDKNLKSGRLISPIAGLRAGTVFAAPKDNPDDLKSIAEGLQKAFADFQAANDARLEEVEGRLGEDVITREQVDRINAEVTRLQGALDDALKQVGRLTASGGAPSFDPKAVEAERRDVRIFRQVCNGGKPYKAEITDDDVEQYRAYRRAFCAYVIDGGQRGETLPEGVRNELSAGQESDGGYWVPTAVGAEIARLFDTSPMRSISNVETIATDRLEMPLDLEKATSGGWVAEKATRSETATPGVGVHTIEVHEQYAEPHATQRILDDASRDVEAWLAAKIAEIFMLTENTAFVTGTGVTQPRGVMSYSSGANTTADATRAWGVVQYTATGASAGFPTVSGVPSASDPDALITVIANLKQAYRSGARWIMNRGTEATVRKLKDGDGRYLIGMGDLRDDASGFSLLGYPISNMEDMADVAADSFSMAFGNFAMAYTIVDRQGIRVLRDPYTSKPFVKFYSTKRTGADVVNFDALKYVKFGTS